MKLDYKDLTLKYSNSEWGVARTELVHDPTGKSVKRIIDTENYPADDSVYESMLKELTLKVIKDNREEFDMEVEPVDGDYRRTKYTLTHASTGKSSERVLYKDDVMIGEGLFESMIEDIVKMEE